MSTQARQEQVKQIHDAFMLLMRVSKRWFVQRLQIYNLTLPQFVTLAALAAHSNACTMSDITNVTFQDPPTTTGVIDRLVKTGLVERTRSQIDRRVVLVQATQAGTDLVNQIEKEMMQESTAGYRMMADDELDTLEHLLKKLVRIHLGQYMSLNGTELDAEIAKLEQFTKDPIAYTKLEQEEVV